ncbi:MAG TPA: hypothetical protein P5556_01690 [Candidatus Gastranaerophilales bacterium]|nr:hypothetical protein [Candidatus Gastranaerophilales bacterium]
MFTGKEAILEWLAENQDKITGAAEFDFTIESVGAEGILGKLPWLNNLGVVIIPDIDVDDDTLDYAETFLLGNMGGNYAGAIIIGQSYYEDSIKRLIELRKMSTVFAALELKESDDQQELLLKRLFLNP